MPLVFLPGGLHLPTIPAHRKVNSVDLGTADKVGVAALALWFDSTRRRAASIARRSPWSRSARPSRRSWSSTGDDWSTRRPERAARSGCGREEAGTARSPTGAVRSPRTTCSAAAWPTWATHGPDAFRESLIKHVAGLQAVTPFERIYLSGRGLEQPEIA